MKTNHLRTTVLSCVLCLMSCISLQAQWVSIPDTNFGWWLNTNGYSACLQGNNSVGWQMDTSCPAVVNATSVKCVSRSIRVLTGIQYFDNLDSLDCSYNQLTLLPTLPVGLTRFNCNNNLLTALPALPGGITWFNCDHNQLNSLPILPVSLRSFWCGYNQLTSIPALPGDLRWLSCGDNRQLSALPALPVGVTYLECRYCYLYSLPALPGGLTALYCAINQLTSLPALPSSLTYLECQYNQISSMPNLPAGLTYLDCFRNLIPAMPVLPGGLTYLNCGYNLLSSLPTLPGSLTGLRCDFNQLSTLPALPASLGSLLCNNNQLSSIPELPDSLFYFYCQYNQNLNCLPELKKVVNFQFDNTGITCLPNYPQSNTSSLPILSSVPLCNYFNANGCDVYWNISGKAYYDVNNNCADDVVDTAHAHIKLQLYANGIQEQQVLTGGEGYYSFDVDNFGTYDFSVDTTNIPFRITCPSNGARTSNITALDSMDFTMDFALTCKPGFDLEAHSVVTGVLRPANVTTINISAGDASNFYGAHCAAGSSGAVTVTYSGAVTYISPGSGALTPTVSGNTLTYNIADFGNVNFFNDFNFIVQTDTNAVLGSQVCFTVSVTPTIGDNNPANNTLTQCFTVVGSFDPNDKQVYPLSDVDVNGEQWLTYTVRFQNTGTDTAYHIYITDTLDADLDASTFQLLAYSHQPMVQLKENAVRFNFPNIMLVDSHANEPLSHGYVQYKIKIKDGKPVGTVINNTAFIYFDFNAPVVTNTTSNTIAVINSVGEVRNQKSEIRIYPNPASNSVTISVDESMLGATATITDITGRSMAAVQLQTVNSKFSTENFSNGVYLVNLEFEAVRITKKLIIQK